MSGAPNIRGNNQLPNPPIKIGITMKKIITNAWAVTITLYKWSFPSNDPGFPNSIRISILSPVPYIPLHAPAIKYQVPISLWLQDQLHLLPLSEIEVFFYPAPNIREKYPIFLRYFYLFRIGLTSRYEYSLGHCRDSSFLKTVTLKYSEITSKFLILYLLTQNPNHES